MTPEEFMTQLKTLLDFSKLYYMWSDCLQYVRTQLGPRFDVSIEYNPRTHDYFLMVSDQLNTAFIPREKADGWLFMLTDPHLI